MGVGEQFGVGSVVLAAQVSTASARRGPPCLAHCPNGLRAVLGVAVRGAAVDRDDGAADIGCAL
jgi:hypothetical protein